jgi:NAD-dependent deacetylase
VIELHGSVHRNYCVDCGRAYGMDAILHSTGVPHCSSCGGVIKPDVVLYEEPLDGEALQEAAQLLTDADVAVVGGTSLNVYPAAGLVDFYRGDQLVLINRTPTPADGRADLVIRAPIGEVLAAAVG